MWILLIKCIMVLKCFVMSPKTLVESKVRKRNMKPELFTNTKSRLGMPKVLLVADIFKS